MSPAPSQSRARSLPCSTPLLPSLNQGRPSRATPFASNGRARTSPPALIDCSTPGDHALGAALNRRDSASCPATTLPFPRHPGADAPPRFAASLLGASTNVYLPLVCPIPLPKRQRRDAHGQ